MNPDETIFGYRISTQIYLATQSTIQTKQAYRFCVQLICEDPDELYADDAEWIIKLVGEKLFIIPQQQTAYLVRDKNSDKLTFAIEIEETGHREIYLTIHENSAIRGQRRRPPIELCKFRIRLGEARANPNNIRL
jgi:hypothetical protein